MTVFTAEKAKGLHHHETQGVTIRPERTIAEAAAHVHDRSERVPGVVGIRSHFPWSGTELEARADWRPM